MSAVPLRVRSGFFIYFFFFTRFPHAPRLVSYRVYAVAGAGRPNSVSRREIIVNRATECGERVENELRDAEKILYLRRRDDSDRRTRENFGYERGIYSRAEKGVLALSADLGDNIIRY